MFITDRPTASRQPPFGPTRRCLARDLAKLLAGTLAAACLWFVPATVPAVAQEAGDRGETATATGTAPSEVYRPGEGSEEASGDEMIEGDDLEVFVDTVEVRVVNVDVYVTDKKGNRVTGLTRDDFELFEDRRPVQVTNFYAVEGGKPVEGAAEPAARETGDDADSTSEPPPLLPQEGRDINDVPLDQRLFLVVYIDNFNIHPANRNRVLDDIGYFLTTEVQKGDQVMLVSYDRSLHIRRPFTAEPAAVARGLEELERLTGHAPNRDDERRQALENISQSRGQGQASAYARMHAESMQNDLRFSMGALREMLDQLGGLPGRKALLYVSDGLPMVPGQDVFHAIPNAAGASAISDSFQYDASREFDSIANAANANRVTFYTIDAAGLRLASTFAAENANPSVNLQVDSVYNSNHQSPLRYMAEETGGLAVVNTNRILPRMKAIADDFGSYYSLGYSPVRAGSGRYHDIRVRVKGRKDLVVRHRKGYRDKSVEAQMTDGTLSALRFGFLSNPLGVRLAFDEAARRDNRFYVVPVNVEIPLKELVFVPRANSHEARVRLYLAALDSDGDSSAVQQVALPISIPADEIERAQGQRYRYTVSLLMRSGQHQVSVGVRDEIASRESFVVDSVVVGSAPSRSRELGTRLLGGGGGE